MSFYGDLPVEKRVSDSGSEYHVKVNPEKEAARQAKNKAAEQPTPVTSTTAKGETPVKAESAPKAK